MKPSTVDRRPSSAGFTLLEMMVALFTLAMLMAAAYQGYFTISKGRTVLESAAEMDAQNMAILHQMARELQSAYLINDPGRSNVWPGAGQVPRTFFICEDQSFGGYEWNRISFTTLAHTVLPLSDLTPNYDSQLAQVEYEVVPSDDGADTGILIKREIHPIGASADPTESAVHIAEGIVGLDFSCQTADGSSGAGWDSRLLGVNGILAGLPAMVGITLTTKSPNGEVQVHSTKIFIPMSSNPKIRM